MIKSNYECILETHAFFLLYYYMFSFLFLCYALTQYLAVLRQLIVKERILSFRGHGGYCAVDTSGPWKPLHRYHPACPIINI